jgi:NSS family neurotransmitter:Na+ symporter
VGQEGGAAFLFVYLACIVAIGFPILLVELAVGRQTGKSVVGALIEIGEGIWEYLGLGLTATAFLLLSYYTVVAGWVLRYVSFGLGGDYPSTVEAATTQFTEVSVGLDTAVFHGIFMIATVTIVALGLRKGVEIAAKLMIPTLVILLAVLAYYAYGLSGTGEAYAYYLIPDWEVLIENWSSLLPAAVGQAFFNLALGMGVMLTYSSYIDRDENLIGDASLIIALDTVISFVVGLIVFPILFTAGAPIEGSGHGTALVSLSAAFGNIPGGETVGVLFFGTVVVAALLSTVSLLEVIVSYMLEQEEFARSRVGATAGAGLGMFLVGLPTAFSLSIFGAYDLFIDRIMIVFGSLLLTVYVGWRFSEEALDELSKGAGDLGRFGKAWIWTIRYPAAAFLVIVLLLGVTEYVELIQETAQELLN